MLSGCDASHLLSIEEERQFKILQEAGASEEELCSAAKKIEQAYLEREDIKEYKDAKNTADIYCRRYGAGN